MCTTTSFLVHHCYLMHVAIRKSIQCATIYSLAIAHCVHLVRHYIFISNSALCGWRATAISLVKQKKMFQARCLTREMFIIYYNVLKKSSSRLQLYSYRTLDLSAGIWPRSVSLRSASLRCALARSRRAPMHELVGRRCSRRRSHRDHAPGHDNQLHCMIKSPSLHD
jgi:hypothetical protein